MKIAKMPDANETFEDRMSKCQENMKVIKSQLDQILELLQYQARWKNSVYNGVKPDIIDVEKKALNTMRVNSQHQVETGIPNEDVYVTGEICGFVEVNMEEPSHFSEIIEKNPHHEPIKDKYPLGYVY
ncbi:hypothetical protein PVK06_024680 [Gossypium arboreum]|uniref:Uncharacterized protein n=1 Tax=Gossypium arboreum TaxID=29729 RepID=A0ABR0PEI9_GOSAR|nr:hypothetical protein PVK06_024680 [Gossypium arboreum]